MCPYLGEKRELEPENWCKMHHLTRSTTLVLVIFYDFLIQKSRFFMIFPIFWGVRGGVPIFGPKKTHRLFAQIGHRSAPLWTRDLGIAANESA